MREVNIKMGLRNIFKRNNFSGTDNLEKIDFARTFKKYYEECPENLDNNHLNFLFQLIKKWDKKCSQDYNLTCAGLLMFKFSDNKDNLPIDEFKQAILTSNPNSVVDSSLAEWYKETASIFLSEVGNISLNEAKEIIYQYDMIPEQPDTNPTRNNFNFLNNLIADGEISLTDDVVFEENERHFKNGIIIENKNLLIEGNDYSIDGKNDARIFVISNSNVKFKNIVFKNSNGSAIKNLDSDLEFIDCIFENNSDEETGGVLFNSSGFATFKDCFFRQNNAKHGGAIFNLSGKFRLEDCIFLKNFADDGGGSIYSCDETIFVNECIFDGNMSSTNGGAIMSENNSKFHISDCQFMDNSSRIGGAIYNLNSEIHLKDCGFENNFADESASVYGQKGKTNIDSCIFKNENANLGGSISTSSSEFKIINSKFINNKVNEDGGAIRNEGGEYFIEKCLFKKCSGNYAGAISNKHGKISIFDSKFLDNSSNIQGGAIVNEKSIVITDSQFVKNFSYAHGGAIYNRSNAKLEIGHSIFQCNSVNSKYDDAGRLIHESGYPGYGGGICNIESKLTVKKCNFEENLAREGGALYSEGGKHKIINCEFKYNKPYDVYE